TVTVAARELAANTAMLSEAIPRTTQARHFLRTRLHAVRIAAAMRHSSLCLFALFLIIETADDSHIWRKPFPSSRLKRAMPQPAWFGLSHARAGARVAAFRRQFRSVTGK